MATTKKARNRRVGDIIVGRDGKTRIITNIDLNLHKSEAYMFRTTTLDGENPRFNTYAAEDPIVVLDTREELSS
nr:MAG TPA: hypothetical protein [Caudoviricetes sp.]